MMGRERQGLGKNALHRMNLPVRRVLRAAEATWNVTPNTSSVKRCFSGFRLQAALCFEPMCFGTVGWAPLRLENLERHLGNFIVSGFDLKPGDIGPRRGVEIVADAIFHLNG